MASPYLRAPSYVYAWRELCAAAGGSEAVVGRSRDGRELWRFDFGAEAGTPVLLTGLVHGVELIGSMALFSTLRAIVSDAPALLERFRFVVLPVVNPDAHAVNTERHARGDRAWQRCNARGVDLNRNFPAPRDAEASLHPFAGSRFRALPHYSGPHASSEPETRAVTRLARELRPALALGFHSFGELLLYPWGHTKRENPRAPDYRRLGGAFTTGQRGAGVGTYAVKQSVGFYPTVGDLDDWLDDELGTLAFTLEVGALDRHLWSMRALDPFWWMNPSDTDAAVAQCVPGVLALLRAAADEAARVVPAAAAQRGLDLAAR